MNKSIFFWLNDLGSGLPDVLWIHLTNLGDTAVALCVLLALYRYKVDRGARLLFVAIVATIVIQGLKHLLNVDRPPIALSIESFHLIGGSVGSPAFPSGHTATAFVCAGLLYAQYHRFWVLLVGVFFASLIGLSRIMVGVHWPADVLVGAVLGWIVGYYGYRLALQVFIARWVDIGLGLLVLTIVVVNMALYRMPYKAFSGVTESQWVFLFLALLGVCRAIPAFRNMILRG